MLEKLLTEIKSGSTHSIGDLSVKLNSTPAMIQALLEHLAELKLISQYKACDDTCTACSVKNLCNSDQPGRVNGLYYIETTETVR